MCCLWFLVNVTPHTSAKWDLLCAPTKVFKLLKSEIFWNDMTFTAKLANKLCKRKFDRRFVSLAVNTMPFQHMQLFRRSKILANVWQLEKVLRVSKHFYNLTHPQMHAKEMNSNCSNFKYKGQIENGKTTTASKQANSIHK